MPTDNNPVHGIGQGNGGGPAIWLSHLVVMFWMLAPIKTGIFFTSPNRTTKFESPGTGFVDDVTLGATVKAETSNEATKIKLVKKINTIAGHWE